MSEELHDALQLVVEEVRAARQKLQLLIEQINSIRTISREEMDKLNSLYEKLADWFGHGDDITSDLAVALTDLAERSGLLEEG